MMLFKRAILFLSLLAGLLTGPSINALQASSAAFSTIANAHPSTASTFINQEGYKELNYDAVISILNRCETPFGHWGLKEMLTHPLTTIGALTLRQNTLEILIDNTQAFDEYRKIIQKTNRPQVLTYWQPANPLHLKLQQFYYNFFGFFPKISDYLNSSKTMLNSAGNADSVLTVIGYFAKNFLGSASKEFMRSSHHKIPANYIQAIKDGFYYPIHLLNPFQSYFKETTLSNFSPVYDSQKLSGGDWKAYAETFITNDNLISAAPYLATIGTVLAVGIYDYYFVKDIDAQVTKIKNTYNTMAEIKAAMHEIAQWYNGCAELYAFSQKNPLFAELHPFQVIKKYIHDQHDVSPELKQLFEYLASEELKNSTATSISTGAALSIHKLLLQIKDELIPLMKALGECDALLSIVKVYKEHHGTHAPCCLPEFTQDAPSLECIHFWHPGLTSRNPVTNTVHLGNNNPRNIIITGPNGGGKSTSMAAISWGIILAQGWGIVPAQKATMRVFTGLRTYLSPQADLEQGMSTFMAEKRRLDTIINTIDNLKNSDAYFFIVDEPCRGTIERVAEQFVIRLCNKLAESDKCISVLATHLEKPTFLAQENAHYTNYQMELLDNEQSFIRTFKLLPGAADWWFNNEPKRTRFLLEL